MKQSTADIARQTAPALTDANLGRYGNELRNSTRVAKVWCFGFRAGVQPRRSRL